MLKNMEQVGKMEQSEQSYRRNLTQQEATVILRQKIAEYVKKNDLVDVTKEFGLF